jgi:hypothetical protein
MSGLASILRRGDTGARPTLDLEEVLADLISRQYRAGTPQPPPRTHADYQRYISPHW